MPGPSLSTRSRSLLPSATQTLDARVKALIADGVDVINLTVGEPDFETLDDARGGGVAAIREGFTRYTPAAGMLALRRAITDQLRERYGLEYQPEEVVVSNGAKQSLFNAFMALLDPGDEVIIQAPYWVSYPEMVRLAGGVPVIVDTGARTGFRMTPEMVRAHCTPRTRILNLNSPSNPTGVVYEPGELRALAAFAVERDLTILSDEIYDQLVYEGVEFASVAALGREIWERTVTINGFSKTYAMTGWRLGYAAAPRPLAKAMADIQGHTTSGPSSISQRAGLAAASRPQPQLEVMRTEFDRRRRFVVERLADVRGVELEVVPKGAFYVFPRVDGCYGGEVDGRPIATSDDFAMLLLEKAGVALVPGTGFGAPDHVRISYATSMEQLEVAMDRLAAFAGSLTAPARA